MAAGNLGTSAGGGDRNSSGIETTLVGTCGWADSFGAGGGAVSGDGEHPAKSRQSKSPQFMRKKVGVLQVRISAGFSGLPVSFIPWS